MKRFIIIASLLAAVGLFFMVTGAINKPAPSPEPNYYAMNQAALDKLPDWAQTFILTVGVLVGIEVIGKHFLIFSVVMIQGTTAIVIIFVMQIFVLLTRQSSDAAHRYTFYASCLLAGLVAFGEGVMMTSVPGGAAVFRTQMYVVGFVVFLALGGGFRFKGPKVNIKYVTEGDKTTATTEIEAPTIALSGRGNTNPDIFH